MGRILSQFCFGMLQVRQRPSNRASRQKYKVSVLALRNEKREIRCMTDKGAIGVLSQSQKQKKSTLVCARLLLLAKINQQSKDKQQINDDPTKQI